jgi:hypothetical protein
MQTSKPIPRSIATEFPVADESLGPFDYVCASDLENEPPRQPAWRRFLVQLLCWWPDE